MIFRLYSDDSCLTQVGADIVINNVPVTGGLFTVQLHVDQDDFNGQMLQLEVEVGGVSITCQEILPVPYALSLRPGAIIMTESTAIDATAITGVVSSTLPGKSSAGILGINTAAGDEGFGVYGLHEGDGAGVYGFARGAGAGVYGNTAGSDGYGVYGSHISSFGTAPGVYGVTASEDGDAHGVEGVVLSTTPGSYSAGVRGINHGTGANGIGVYGSQDGWGWGVYGQVEGDGKGVYGKAEGSNGVGVYGAASGKGVYGKTDSVNGVGVHGEANGADGIGVFAQGGGSTSMALKLSNGGIEVNGAGMGTSTPVFIHQATDENIVCAFYHCTLIDHPLTNGDPDAILFVTQNFNYHSYPSAVNNIHPVGVQYLDVVDRWVIYNVDLYAMPPGAIFNVLVVKP